MAEEIKTLNELGDAGVVDKPVTNEVTPVQRVPVRDEPVVRAAHEQVRVLRVILEAAERGGGLQLHLGRVRVVDVPDVAQDGHALHAPVLD